MSNIADTNYDCVVIGGGAAGMMAAGRAAEGGARVLLLEKNKELGKKLAVSGGGRCNITNAETDVRKFLDHFPQAKQFLFSPFSQFDVQSTFDFFEKLKLPLVVEARKRAFPKTQQAPDVVHALERYMKKAGVTVLTSTKIKGINPQDDGSFIVRTGRRDYQAPFVVLATGGKSAPTTGSTGDGFRFAAGLGHNVSEPRPNIVPLTTDARWVHRLSGLSLSFMRLRFIQNNKIEWKKVGKVLFTHFGISGPLVLNASYDVQQLMRWGNVTASIDLFPDTELGDLNKRLIKLFDANKNKLLKNVLPEMLPETLSKELIHLPHIDLGDRVINEIKKEERKALVDTMKDLRFPITGTLGFEKAVIADGGVDLREVDFKTMQSRKYPGLFLVGDMLDINRPSGGYSLQLCWTTGWVAGNYINEQLSRTP